MHPTTPVLNAIKFADLHRSHMVYTPLPVCLALLCCVRSLQSIVAFVLEDCGNAIFAYNFERADFAIERVGFRFDGPKFKNTVVCLEIVVRMCPATDDPTTNVKHLAFDCHIASVCRLPLALFINKLIVVHSHSTCEFLLEVRLEEIT
jgi:hypothetical protein